MIFVLYFNEFSMFPLKRLSFEGRQRIGEEGSGEKQ
jgi:hypothetical protein